MPLDVTMLGDRELTRLFERLPEKAQRKIYSKSIRKTLRLINKAVHAAVPVDTGNLKALMKRARITVRKKTRTIVSLGLKLPERSDLGLDDGKKDKMFWPAALEYGHNGVAPRPFIKTASDESWKSVAKNKLINELKNGIEAEAKKK